MRNLFKIALWVESSMVHLLWHNTTRHLTFCHHYIFVHLCVTYEWEVTESRDRKFSFSASLDLRCYNRQPTNMGGNDPICDWLTLAASKGQRSRNRIKGIMSWCKQWLLLNVELWTCVVLNHTHKNIVTRSSWTLQGGKGSSKLGLWRRISMHQWDHSSGSVMTRPSAIKRDISFIFALLGKL